jgi:tRNA (guanine37-N1)-methyltransferase
LKIDIISIFPEYFDSLGVSLIGKAVQRGDIEIELHDLRRWTSDVHRTVDDTPFGGGPGMVMKPEPWGAALDDVASPVGQLVVPTPAGELFTQARAADFAGCSHLIFACGRYEGIDDRVVRDARQRMPVHELSIGDYVLAGGEPAVLVMIEAIGRLIPGVLGNSQSAPDDSFGAGAMSGLVEGPSYTRPRTWRGLDVPDVLLSGDHAAIARWRRDQAIGRTAVNRPDLAARLAGTDLDDHDRRVLSEAGFANDGKDVAH